MRGTIAVLYVGDELEADVGGSLAAGLNGIRSNRGDRQRIDEIPKIGSLLELKRGLGGKGF